MGTNMMRCALLLLCSTLLACTSKSSDGKSPESKSSESNSSKATSSDTSSTAPANTTEPSATASGDIRVFRSELAARTRADRDGTSKSWAALGGMRVSDEAFQRLYTSGDKEFVAFKAKLSVADEDCLVDWRAELVSTSTGRGPVLSTISGLVPLKAHSEMVVSGVVGLSSHELSLIGSVSAGYWSVCGKSMPSPSAHDFAITDTSTEDLKLGTAFSLHHTVFKLQGLAKEPAANTRCYFDIVAEDRNADGFTLNRDFASYSMAPGASGVAKLRRTTFEGGNEKDYAAAAVFKQSYLREVFCQGPWLASSAKLEGIAIADLKLLPATGDAKTAEELVRASYGHAATLSNTIGKNCSFRVRYRLLDKSGVPMNKAAMLSETLHLRKGQSVHYTSADQRLFVWKEQAAELGSLVVEEAVPVNACKGYREELVVKDSSPAPAPH